MGVDENGLGPRLGPLTATAVVMEVPRYQRAESMRRGLAVGINDSKQAGGFGRMALCESLSLALIERVTGRVPATADALLRTATGLSLRRLQSGCPDSANVAQCWSVGASLPLFGGNVDEGRDRIRQLVGRSQMSLTWARSGFACAGALNQSHVAGENKLAVDLRMFEELILQARRECGADLFVVCGMVGGIRNYPAHFCRFKDPRALPHYRGQRRYEVPGIGEVRFEVSADARHLPVALASVLGKYLRELSMHRIAAFYQRHDTTLPAVSGYHDPVTARFVEQTRDARVHLGIASDCFERRA